MNPKKKEVEEGEGEEGEAEKAEEEEEEEGEMTPRTLGKRVEALT